MPRSASAVIVAVDPGVPVRTGLRGAGTNQGRGVLREQVAQLASWFGGSSIVLPTHAQVFEFSSSLGACRFLLRVGRLALLRHAPLRAGAASQPREQQGSDESLRRAVGLCLLAQPRHLRAEHGSLPWRAARSPAGPVISMRLDAAVPNRWRNTPALSLDPIQRLLVAGSTEPRFVSSDAAVRIALKLFRARLEAAGIPVERGTLIQAGWPDECIEPTASINRLNVALSNLRSLGLREFLLRRGRGYLIDPELSIQICAPLRHVPPPSSSVFTIKPQCLQL